VPVKVLILEIRVKIFRKWLCSMIGFEFKCGLKDYEFIFSKYSAILNGELKEIVF
jgi:hypothetical protein